MSWVMMRMMKTFFEAGNKGESVVFSDKSSSQVGTYCLPVVVAAVVVLVVVVVVVVGWDILLARTKLSPVTRSSLYCFRPIADSPNSPSINIFIPSQVITAQQDKSNGPNGQLLRKFPSFLRGIHEQKSHYRARSRVLSDERMI